MITDKSTYDECVAEINASAEEVAAEAGFDVSPEEVWHDLAGSMLRDASPAVAAEVCRCELGCIPHDLRSHIEPWLRRTHKELTTVDLVGWPLLD